jgi:uncharacterized protein (DUF2147 family)
MRCFVMHPGNAVLNLGRPSVLLAGFVTVVCAASASAGPRETGLWIDDTGKGAVRIEICGAKLCGRIAWLKEPLNAEGLPLTDKNNPDPSKQSRTICGLPILGQLEPLPEGGFDGGWVYDPKVGKSYDVAITLTGPDQLQVTGYKGVRFLGKSFFWTRAKTELPPCEAKPAAAASPTGAATSKAAKPSAKKSELPWANTKPAPQGAAVKPKTSGSSPKPASAAKQPVGAAQLGGP